MTRGLQSSRWAPLTPGAGRSSSVPASQRQWSSTTTSTTVTAWTPRTASFFNDNPNGNGPSSAPASTPAPTPVQPSTATSELRRFMKLARRMRWKLPFLADGYRKATATNSALSNAFATDPAEAELMFKLDFFEFYMLCERALVHLQAVFGIHISRSFRDAPKDGFMAEHRYHANVLEALDHEEHPLHGALGCGEVRQQLARAKDLRNRWKNADDAPDRANAPAPLPLVSYDFDKIVTTILEGLDAAYGIAEPFVVELCQAHQQTMEQVRSEVEAQEDFGFMTAAMDWEAV